MKKHIEYVVIRKPDDNSYDIFEKDLTTNKLTFHSNHDTKKEAFGERNSLEGKPSKADSLRFINNLKNHLK